MRGKTYITAETGSPPEPDRDFEPYSQLAEISHYRGSKQVVMTVLSTKFYVNESDSLSEALK